MFGRFYKVYVAIIVFFCFIHPLVTIAQTTTSYTVDISALVPGCGDSLIQLGEQCDGSNLGGSSCSSVGFSAGTLACTPACTFDTTSCTLNTPSPVGRSYSAIAPSLAPIIPKTNLVIMGYSAPGTAVTLLSDGQWVGTAVASLLGTFQLTVSGFSAGEYVLQLIARDDRNNLARSESFVGRIAENSTTKISQLVLPPLAQVIESNQNSVTLLARTVPGAMVLLHSGGKIVQTAVADSAGEARLYVLIAGDTSLLRTYFMQVSYENRISALSIPITFTRPQTEDLPVVTDTTCGRPHDINNDCRINLVDLSAAIHAFVTGIAVQKFDYNGDGKIDIVDFSIMAFYWTG